MNLKDYIDFYISTEGHWYISKVKQFTEDSISQMAKGLLLFNKLLSANPDPDTVDRFNSFKPIRPEQLHLFDVPSKKIRITDAVKLFLSLQILASGLVDLSHLEKTNPEKYQKFTHIKDDFLANKNYVAFITKYGSDYLVSELTVYYRNFESWLSKFGFFGIEDSVYGFLTDIGSEFIDRVDDVRATGAIFTHQVKKLQVWNPTIDDKYRGIKVLPYYAVLQVLLSVPGNYFSRDEYFLFITKIQSHNEESIQQVIDLIVQYRNLSKEEQQQYMELLDARDKEQFPERKRTNLVRLRDSSSKEIGAYCFSKIMLVGEKAQGNIVSLINKQDAQSELEDFRRSAGYIEFVSKYDWVFHLGKLDGLSIEEIIEMYIRSGKAVEEVGKLLSTAGEKELIIQTAREKLLEKEVEDYYEKMLSKIYPHLKLVDKPHYGRQFPTGVGPIDMLCKDISSDLYYVLEFKRGKVPDESIGQILRYMGWISLHLAQPNEKVSGIIIGNRFSEKFDYAIKGMQLDDELISLHKHPFTDSNRPVLES